MNSPHSNRLPPSSRATPETRPMKRHHTARYYAHRVHESLTTRLSKLVCAVFLGLLLTVGLITFILWLSLRPHRPRFLIHEFTVPGLNRQNGFENAQIIFNVTARNANQNIGTYYDSLAGSVYYKDNLIGSSPVLYPFYQKPKNTTVIVGVLTGATLTVNSQRWREFTRDLAKGTVMFRFEISSVIRFKVSTWDSKRHRMHATCNVAVGPDGAIMPTSKNKRCPVCFT